MSEDPDRAECPSCGSRNTDPIQWFGPTGVTSPDGVEEWRTQYGIGCHDCGRIEEL